VIPGEALVPSDSAAFFDNSYFDRWLAWVREFAEANESARLLSRWLDLQASGLRATIDEYRAFHPDQSPVRLLDIGCGDGTYSVGLVMQRADIAIHGIDVSSTLVASANTYARHHGVSDRASFSRFDAGDLQSSGLGSFDIVFCVTNVLGNMAPGVQQRFLEGLHAVLQPQGIAYFSVYSEGSITARIESYQAVGLSVRDEGGRLIAKQGLVSESFSGNKIIDLLTRHGLQPVRGPVSMGEVAWQVVATLGGHSAV
jgi:2-polyprenyl-3-methyl-5-hydroxy-6-metoxy-1,4-benzoquinol methylase